MGPEGSNRSEFEFKSMSSLLFLIAIAYMDKLQGCSFLCNSWKCSDCLSGLFLIKKKKEEFFSKLLNCRATHAVFVVPYQKYIKSISNAVCTGTRFKMRFEMDDSPERRSGRFS